MSVSATFDRLRVRYGKYFSPSGFLVAGYLVLLPSISPAEETRRPIDDLEVILPDLAKAIRDADAFANRLVDTLLLRKRKDPELEPIPTGARTDLDNTEESLHPAQSLKELKDELSAQLPRIMASRNEVKERTSREIRSFVAAGIERCTKAVASNDEITAKIECDGAERRIRQCKELVEPTLAATADRLSAKFQPYFGKEGNFDLVKLHCDVSLYGLESPSRILRTAKLRLPNDSCAQHVARLEEFVKTGVLESRIYHIDDSVANYHRFITEKCAPEFVTSANAIVQGKQDSTVSPLELPRRNATAGTNVVRDTLAKVERGEPLPVAPAYGTLAVDSGSEGGILTKTLDVLVAVGTAQLERDAIAKQNQAERDAMISAARRAEYLQGSEAPMSVSSSSSEEYAQVRPVAPATSKYYPALSCVTVVQSSGRSCAQNNCGFRVSVWYQNQYGSGPGLVEPGKCGLSTSGFMKILGACGRPGNSSDEYSASSQRCQKFN